ncbi:MAG: FG-GAP-like repeat-containing protein, partial [Thermoanaerobaculia bacterium]
NKDGHKDMAFSVHLTGVFVYLGDGKGHFTEASEGLPHDFPTRRLVVADVNQDGSPDLVAVTEGPTPRPLVGAPHGPLIALINKNKAKSWEVVNIAPPGVVTGGDWLSTAQFNEDGRTDFVIGSIFLGSRDIFYLSKGPNEWARLENTEDLIPWGAYYYGNAAGKITSKTHDDAIISYVRYWPGDLDPKIMARPPLLEETAIDRLSFAKDGTATRYPIVRWGGHRPVTGLALADLDGDGNLDVVYTDSTQQQIVILLGDGKGGFTRANTEGLKLLDLGTYDLKVVDVNGDKKPDIVVMYESGASTNAVSGDTTPTFAARNGSVHVFLNRGFVKANAQPQKSSN